MKTDWHKAYLAVHRDNMKILERNAEMRKALEEIRDYSERWMDGQNTFIRSQLLVIDGIVDKALK